VSKWNAVLKKGKCLMGLHEGEWQLDAADGCGQTRTCTNCGTNGHLTEHVFEQWRYAAADACTQQRRCQRCAELEQRVVHERAEPRYDAHGSCAQSTCCQRCGDQEAAGIVHAWSAWRWTANPCVEVEVCGRCGAHAAHGRYSHAWGEWEYSEAHRGAVHRCQRCERVASRSEPVTVPSGLDLTPVTDTAAASSSPTALAELIRRRDAAMAERWTVEEHASSPAASEVLAAARVAIEKLEPIVTDWEGDALTRSDALELGRAYRYLGDARFALSAKRELEALRAAEAAYARAEPMLRSSGDRVALAKLLVDYAHASRCLAAGRDRDGVTAAKARYVEARRVFIEEQPDFVQQVEDALQ
jgi:hypothetical protein